MMVVVVVEQAVDKYYEARWWTLKTAHALPPPQPPEITPAEGKKGKPHTDQKRTHTIDHRDKTTLSSSIQLFIVDLAAATTFLYRLTTLLSNCALSLSPSVGR